MLPQMLVDGSDRYAARPAGTDWCVWDTLRDMPVFGAERMTIDQACALACRLNAAYRQATEGNGALSERSC
jgi:hypothetical protein